MTQQEIRVLLSLTTAGAMVKLNTFVAEAGAQLKSLALNTIGAYAGISGALKFEGALRSAINLQEEVGRISQRTGASVGMIELLRESADAVNVPFDKINTALGLFSKNVYDAANGNIKLSDEFQRLGVSLTLDGKLRSTNDVLTQFIGKIQAMPSGEQKAYAASSELGRAGRELIPVFQQAGDAINHIRDAGGPITDQSVAQATEFDTKLRQLHITLGLIMVRVVNELLPALTNLVDRMSAIAKSSETTKSSVAGLADFLRGLLTIVLVVGLAFENLGQYIGMTAARIYANWMTAGSAVEAIFSEWRNQITALIQLVRDLPNAFSEAAQAFADISTGQFGKAAGHIANLDKIKSDAAAVVQTQLNIASVGADALKKMFNENLTQYSSFFSQVKGQWSNLSDFLHNLWSGKGAIAPVPTAVAGDNTTLGPNTASLQDLRTLVALNETLFKQRMKLIESDPFSTKANKAAAELPLIDAQVKSLDVQLETSKLNEKQAQTDTDRLSAQTESARIQGQINDLLRQRQSLAGQSSVGYNAMADITKYQDQLGTMQEQIGKFLSSPFESLNRGIDTAFDKLMMKGGSFKQFMASVGVSMYQSFAQSLSKMVADFVTSTVMMALKWVATQVLLTTVEGTHIALRLGLVTTGEAAATEATLTGTTARIAAKAADAGAGAASAESSIPYVGPILAIAAMAAMIAAVLAVSRDSGGSGVPGQSYLIGRGAQPELFVPHTSGTFYPRNQITTRSPASVSSAGAGQGGAEKQPFEMHVHYWTDETQMANYIKNTPSGQHAVLDVMSKNMHVYGKA